MSKEVVALYAARHRALPPTIKFPFMEEHQTAALIN